MAEVPAGALRTTLELERRGTSPRNEEPTLPRRQAHRQAQRQVRRSSRARHGQRASLPSFSPPLFPCFVLFHRALHHHALHWFGQEVEVMEEPWEEQSRSRADMAPNGRGAV